MLYLIGKELDLLLCTQNDK